MDLSLSNGVVVVLAVVWLAYKSGAAQAVVEAFKNSAG